MINSAEQLVKYKRIKAELDKRFTKKSGWRSFTIDVSYGGNKEPDLRRICLGGVASDPKLSKDFIELLKQSIEDNIAFWQKAVLRDIKELENSLK